MAYDPTKVGQKAPVKRLGVYSGAGNRDLSLMQNVNARAKRGADGSMQGDGSDQGGYQTDAAFPAGPGAFPVDPEEPQP